MGIILGIIGLLMLAALHALDGAKYVLRELLEGALNAFGIRRWLRKHYH